LDDIYIGVKQFVNGKVEDIEGSQAESFEIRGHILIRHIQNLFNLVVNEALTKSCMQSFIVPIFKNGDRNITFNYRTIMISLILAKTLLSDKSVGADTN
jgi:hypothetical protein